MEQGPTYRAVIALDITLGASMSVLEKSTFAKMFEAAELCRERALDVPMLVLDLHGHGYVGLGALR